MRKIIFDVETDGLITGPAGAQIFPNIYVVAVYDSETDQYSTFTKEELPKLWPIFEKADVLIGYNTDGFDIPVLNHHYSGDLTKFASLDLLEEVRKSLGRRIKLDHIAEATLGRKKISNGLEAMSWWKQGLYDKVKEYCIEDVRITKDVYDYALKNKMLKYKDGANIKEIRIDTSAWDKKRTEAITHTLFG